MIAEGSLTFREFVTREPLPISTIQGEVMEFLRRRDDVVLYGSQAVNAHTDDPRMTQDVDIATVRAVEFAEELRAHLSRHFHIAVRVRAVRDGLGYRLYQVRKEGNRHLVDIRPVEVLPPSQPIDEIPVVTPPELVASKLIASVNRAGTPKELLDRRDLALLLLTFPELKSERGPVRERLEAAGAGADVLLAWSEVVRQPMRRNDPDEPY